MCLNAKCLRLLGPHYGARTAHVLNWQQLPGRAFRVSGAHKGHLIATEKSGEIYEMKDGFNWIRLDGAATHASIGSDGDIWAVTGYALFRARYLLIVGSRGCQPRNGDIYHRQFGAWAKAPGGSAANISVGNKDHIVCTTTSGGIYQWTGMDWKQLDGNAVNAAIGHDGDLWSVFHPPLLIALHVFCIRF